MKFNLSQFKAYEGDNHLRVFFENHSQSAVAATRSDTTELLWLKTLIDDYFPHVENHVLTNGDNCQLSVASNDPHFDRDAAAEVLKEPAIALLEKLGHTYDSSLPKP